MITYTLQNRQLRYWPPSTRHLVINKMLIHWPCLLLQHKYVHYWQNQLWFRLRQILWFCPWWFQSYLPVAVKIQSYWWKVLIFSIFDYKSFPWYIFKYDICLTVMVVADVLFSVSKGLLYFNWTSRFPIVTSEKRTRWPAIVSHIENVI